MKKNESKDKIQIAFDYAVWFYNNHYRSIDNQLACMRKMMELTGFDGKTCAKIQSPIITFDAACEVMSIGSAAIEQHMGIAIQNIRRELFNVAPKIKPEVKEDKASKYPHDYSAASQKDIDKHFVAAYDSSDGRLDINGFHKAGNKDIARTVEHLKYQVTKKDAHNGTGHKVLAHKHTLNFSFNLLSDPQVKGLADFLFWQELNLSELNLSFSSITHKGIEPLFYQLRNAPDVRLHNIKYINLSGNLIDDSGAEYISESLKSGRYPHLKSLDVSGNKITEKGQGFLAGALQHSKVQDVTVTLEVHSSKGGVIGFIKKAVSYAIEQHSKAQAFSEATDVALFGDLAYCKKAFKDVSLDVATGIIKDSMNPVRKLKFGKKLLNVGVFVTIAEESTGILSKDMLKCIAAINGLYGVTSVDEFTSSLSGNLEDVFDY